MKLEDIRVEMVVEVVDAPADSKKWFKGQTFLVKGIIYHKGRWWVLPTPVKEDLQIETALSISSVEPIKSELDKQVEQIKKETSS